METTAPQTTSLRPPPAPERRRGEQRWADRVVVAAATVLIVMAVLVLAGWLIGVDELASIIPGLPAMRMTAAACMLAFAAAALGLRTRTPAGSRLATVLGAAVVFVALLALLVRAVGLDAIAALYPATGGEEGLLSVGAGIGLGFVGLAYAVHDLDPPRYRAAAPTLVLAGLISFTTLIGWAYDVDYLRAGAGRGGVALTTAIGLTVATLALLCVRPERGALALVDADTGVGLTARRLLVVAVASPVAIGLIVFLATEANAFDERVAASLVTVLTTLILLGISIAFLRRSQEAELAERRFARGQRSFEAVADSAIEAIVTADASGRIIYVNPATERIFGWPASELIGAPLTRLMPERYREAHQAGLAHYLATKERKVIGSTVELEGLRRDGRIFPLSLSLSDWESEGETFFTGVLGDISERVEAEHQNRLLANIVDASDDAVFSRGLDGLVTSWNHGAEQLYGWTAEEVVGTDASFHVPEELRDELDTMLARVLRGEILSDVDTIRLRKDGRRVEVSLTITPLSDSSGGIFGLATIARDVTARRQMEAEVAAERARLADAQRLASLGSYQLDLDTGEMIWSRQMLINYGIDPDSGVEPTREDGIARVHPDDRDRVRLRNAELIETARPFTDRYRVVWPDGEVRYMEVHGGILNDRNGSRIMVGTSRDVTAEQEAERAKDEFFGLISHELRTPLTSIIGYTDLIKDYEEEAVSPQAMRWIDVIDRNARRQLRLVQDLLMLARLEARRFEIRREMIDIGKIVRSHVDDARDAAAAKQIEIDLIDARVGRISGDPHRLGQVVENLVSNAIKFSPEGGRVGVELRDVGAQTVLDVSDQGIGIPEDEVNKVFDRLFRASTASEMHIQGTGLGLTIVKAIVEEHGGTIGVSSQVGSGSRFRVVLPHQPTEDAATGATDGERRREAAIQDVRGD
ncbi:PAS domain S-box protein [Thermoleophilia bacterium SCSIO 60948]|nr:PAS domain S-box protein [Thermoleophilia bacterium SCSIO 60948]